MQKHILRKAISIHLVDDDQLFIDLLELFLKEQQDIAVHQTFKNGNDLLAWLKDNAQHPDVILLDLRMPEGNGMEALTRLYRHYPKIKIVVISTFYRKSFMGQMLKLGADAFLSKDIQLPQLLEAIYAVVNSGHYFTADQVEVMRSQISHKTPQLSIPQKDGISERELEVLRLLCQQLTTAEIADRLFVSAKTIETHRSNLFSKTNTRNVAGLIIYAIQNKLVDPNELVLINW